MIGSIGSAPRALLAEFLGTLLLLAIVVGSGIMGERLAEGNAAVCRGVDKFECCRCDRDGRSCAVNSHTSRDCFHADVAGVGVLGGLESLAVGVVKAQPDE